MKRVMIIGGAGSGKSTAARMIGEALGLPVYHMDRDVYWLPGWQERPDAERRRIVGRIVAQEAWVFEGSYSGTFQQRLDRAEMLVWLDVPVWRRSLRVVRRSFKGWGRVRSDLADGCKEDPRMLPDFLGFIWRTRRGARARAEALFERAAIEKHRLRTIPEVNLLVAHLARQR